MKKDQLFKRPVTLLATPFLALTLSTPLSAGEVYKWIDDEGVTHYGERAPSDKSYSLIKTYGEVPSGAEEAKQRLGQQRAETKETEQKELQYAEQEKLAEQQAKIRAENCRGAKSNLKTIEENARVRILGEDGEFRYLTEEERQAEIGKAKEIITENCNEA